jgi:hypothetical protein
MHFEILVEDASGKKMLEILLPKILGDGHTSRVIAYRGVGRIPKDMRDSKDAGKRILLDNLPRLLKGYGRTFPSYGDNGAAVILVCDLDDKCLKSFREELFGILNNCHPKPEARFCIAIEEGEAWLLGDLPAVNEAYPKAKNAILSSYVNDSICGTWEKLADAIYNGGSSTLAALGFYAVGEEKSKWAEAISPRMDISNNNSPSFCYFRNKLLELVEAG